MCQLLVTCKQLSSTLKSDQVIKLKSSTKIPNWSKGIDHKKFWNDSATSKTHTMTGHKNVHTQNKRQVRAQTQTLKQVNSLEIWYDTMNSKQDWKDHKQDPSDRSENPRAQPRPYQGPSFQINLKWMLRLHLHSTPAPMPKIPDQDHWHIRQCNWNTRVLHGDKMRLEGKCPDRNLTCTIDHLGGQWILISITRGKSKKKRLIKKINEFNTYTNLSNHYDEMN